MSLIGSTSFASAPLQIIDGDRGSNYPKQNDFSSNGYCLFLNAGNVTKSGFSFSESEFVSEEKDAALRKGKLQRHDIVLTTRGTVGNVAYYSELVPYENVRINSGMVVLRVDQSRIYPYFLYLFLRSSAFSDQVAYLTSGSAQPQLPIRDMNCIEMPLPSLEEQREVCGIFGALDSRITNLQDVGSTLEGIAKALFKSWFIDFDPVRAKSEGREPEGMSADIAALFPSDFVDSELGPIPKGWRVGKLGDLSELNPESWTARSHPQLITYIDLANVKENRIESVVNYSFGEAPSRARRALRDGDTIVGTVRPGNRSFAYIRGSSPGLTGSTGFAVLRAKSPLHSEFIYLATTRDENIDQLAHVADGGAYPAVRPEVVANLQAVIPPSEVINAFGETINPLFSKISVSSAQEATLTNLRDILLPRLLSGAITVPS